MSPEYEASAILLRRAALQHGLAGQAALEGEFVPRAKVFLAEARELQLAAHRAGVRGGEVARLRSDAIDILFDAYREFLVTATRPVRLRIVGPHARNCGGGGEEYYRGLRERAASLGASVEWCEPAFGAEQLQRFYAEAHVLVYPSIAAKGEASPLTPVEAMASACVPVVSDLKCFADYLTDGVNGFTFPLTPSPSTNLARVLTKASSPETSLVSIQQCCLKTAQEYSLSNVATLYEVDFLEILSSRENLAADSRDLLASRPLHPNS